MGATAMPDLDNLTWLHQTYYTETLKVFAMVWTIYIGFYTAFLSANVLGLGLTVQYIHLGNRFWVVVAFTIQNLLTAATSIGVARYGTEADKKLKQVAHLLTDRTDNSVARTSSPIPIQLSRFAGYANCIGCITLIVCWIAVNSIPDPPAK